MSTGPASKPMVDLAILDEAGEPLAQGQTGEVCIRSICNFDGYWNNPEATKAAFFANGYFRTGDLGYLDAAEYLFIVDRQTDIIIRGGENISSSEERRVGKVGVGTCRFRCVSLHLKKKTEILGLMS